MRKADRIVVDRTMDVRPGDILEIGNHGEFVQVIKPPLFSWSRFKAYWFRT